MAVEPFNNPSWSSPFKDINGFQDHDNWLHNLLIASSMNGRRPGTTKSARTRDIPAKTVQQGLTLNLLLEV